MATDDLEKLAKEHGFSIGAVQAMADALARGNGTAAQFNHPELGGMVQWMPGMVMIGDFGNHLLKHRVSTLGEALASLYNKGRVTAPASFQMQFTHWWPQEFGEPSTSGEQGNTRYAFFPKHRRLLLMRDKKLRVYDTGHHHISGVSQQQSDGIQILVFTTSSKTLTEEDFTWVDFAD